MKKISIGFIIAFLFAFTFVNALSCEETCYGCVEQNYVMDIPQIANGTSYCNITKIRYPNKTVATTNAIMVKNGISYNFEFENTTVLGQYIVEGECNGQIFTCDFIVTPTGYQASTSQSFITFFGIFIMIIMSFVFLILAWAFKTPPVKIFFLSLSLLTLAFTVGYNLKIMKDTTGEFVSFSNLFTSFYTLLTIMLTVASFALMLFLIVGTFKYFYNLKNGYREEKYDTYNIH